MASLSSLLASARVIASDPHVHTFVAQFAQEITSSWVIDEHGVRPLGARPRLAPGQHRLTAEQDAERRTRAIGESTRRKDAR